MKRYLAIFTLLAGPIYANTIPAIESSAELDDVTAKVAAFCKSAGSNKMRYCAENFVDQSGALGTVKIAAASKCVAKAAKQKAYAEKMMDLLHTDRERMRQQGGVDVNNQYHSNYEKDTARPDEPAHRHEWDDIARDQAGQKEGVAAIVRARDRASGRPTTSSSETHDMKASEGGIAFGMAFGETISKGTLTPLEVSNAYAAGYVLGYLQPWRTDVKPSGACYENGDCKGSDGVKYSNKYQNEASMEEHNKEELKKLKDDEEQHRKNSADESTKDIDTSLADNKGTSGLSNIDASNDDVGPPADIARESLEGYGEQTQMNKCINAEYEKSMKKIGSKTVDQEAATRQSDKNALAASLLKTGYCDEKVYGKAICQRFRNEQASVKGGDVTIHTEAQESALATFRHSGICISKQLGVDFCEGQKKAVEITPFKPDFDKRSLEHFKVGPTTFPRNFGVPETVGPLPIRGGNPGRVSE